MRLRSTIIYLSAIASLVSTATAKSLRKLAQVDSTPGSFYADYVNLKCGKNCPQSDGLPCMGPPPPSSGLAELFQTAEECCQNRLHWIDLGTCVANTNGTPNDAEGSADWYVDWNVNFGTCVVDCNGPPPCGGLKENWEPGHPTADACCATIPWQPYENCRLPGEIPDPTSRPTLKPTLSSSPSIDLVVYEPAPTQSPIELEFIFDGIEVATSVFHGVVDLLWNLPTDTDGVDIDIATANVNYHILVSVDGSYNFEESLEALTAEELVSDFEENSQQGDESSFYVFIDDGAELDYELDTSLGGKLHDILVIAEVDGIFSRNTESTQIVASSVDPVMKDSVNIVGIFVPDNNLDITYDEGTNELEFSGSVRDEHKDIAVGDYVYGVYGTITDPATFFLLVTKVTTSTDSLVALEVESAELEDIFDVLDYGTSLPLSRPNQVDPQRSRRHLTATQVQRELNHNWFHKAVSFVFSPVQTFVSSVVTTVAPAVWTLITTGQLNQSYNLASFSQNFNHALNPTSSAAGSVSVQSSVSVTIQIGLGNPLYVGVGWQASYSATMDLDLSGDFDASAQNNLWTGNTATFVFNVLGIIPVPVEATPKVDLVCSANGQSILQVSSATVSAQGAGSASAYASTFQGTGTSFVAPNLTPILSTNVLGDRAAYTASLTIKPAVDLNVYNGKLAGEFGIPSGIVLKSQDDLCDITGTPLTVNSEVDFVSSIQVSSLSSTIVPSWTPGNLVLWNKVWPLISLPDFVVICPQYFRDYTSGSCLRGCNPGPLVFEQGCTLIPPPEPLYDDIDSCCNAMMSAVDYKYCASRSMDTYSGGWVVDWTNEKCIKDCNPADNGPPCTAHTDVAAPIFDTYQDCCQTLDWIPSSQCHADSFSYNPGSKVVTLGDSYSSGVGLYQRGNQYDVEFGGSGNFDDTSYGSLGLSECWRETNDIAGPKLAAALGLESIHLACSGAHTGNFQNQIDLLDARGKDIDWAGSTILFTIGGNDVRTVGNDSWVGLVIKCIATRNCHTKSNNQLGNLATVRNNLDIVYAQLATFAQNARIRVMGYPHLFQRYTEWWRPLKCPGVTGINKDEADWLDSLSDDLNGVIIDAVNMVKTNNPALDIEFVPVTNYIAAGACRSSSSREINDKVCKNSNSDFCFSESTISFSSFHPSRRGYDEYEAAFLNSL